MNEEMKKALDGIHYHLMKSATRWAKYDDDFSHGVANGCHLSYESTARAAGMDPREVEQAWDEYDAMLWGC